MKPVIRKTLKRTAIALIVVAIPLAAFFGLFIYRFVPIVPKPRFSEPNSRAEAMRQDIEYLATFVDHDWSFTEDGKAQEFRDFVAELATKSGSLSDAQLELAVARALALADNSHTNVSPVSRSQRLNRLPLRVARFREGFFVIQATRPHESLLGARILACDGVPVEDVLEGLGDSHGGNNARAHYFAPHNLASPQWLNAAGIANDPQHLTVEVRLRNGDRSTVQLEALPSGYAIPAGRSLYHSEPALTELEDWVEVVPAAGLPSYLRNSERPFDSHAMDDNGLYIRLDSCSSQGEWNIGAFLREVLTETRNLAPRMAVVDLRFNSGGTNTLESFVKNLLELIPEDGAVYVLTSAGTFSYGIAAAVMFKHYGGSRVVMAGTPVGDRLRFWANGGTSFTLPNSGISMRAWSALEDYRDGCHDWWRCFWFSPTFRHEGFVDELNIDLPVLPQFSDYLEGRDTALRTILDDFRARQ